MFVINNILVNRINVNDCLLLNLKFKIQRK
jgi:hypothetical protein